MSLSHSSSPEQSVVPNGKIHTLAGNPAQSSSGYIPWQWGSSRTQGMPQKSYFNLLSSK